MTVLTEEERRKWYPQEYADAEALAKKLIEDAQKVPAKMKQPKVKDTVLQNDYTCQDCLIQFKTWNDFTIIPSESPLCDRCKQRRIMGKIGREGWQY